MKLHRLFLAAAGLFAIAACSGQGGTSNSIVPNGLNPGGPPNPPSQSSKVRAVCGTHAPAGYATCFALQRTDVFYSSAPAYVAKRAPQGGNLKTLASSNFFSPLDPAHIVSAYKLPPNTKGYPQTVAIVDAYNNPKAEADMNTYRSTFGLPPCTTLNGCFRKLNQAGNPGPYPPNNGGWAEEISLDLDMVSAVCPKCDIILVEANNSSFANLSASEFTAKNKGATEISNSYGGSEFQASDPNYDYPNVVVTASTGDSSWFAGPQSPASYPSVVAVGGTSIYPYNNARGWIETAWDEGGSACTQLAVKPTWQSGTGCANRAYSDVSAVADPFTGVLVYLSYPLPAGFYAFGGTSVSSPIIASVYALAGGANGSFGDPYAGDQSARSVWAAGAAHSPALTDVTIGNNGQQGFLNNAGQTCTPAIICYAAPGWDAPTGWGTPFGTGAF